jgi:hypothetical protein
MSFEKGLLSAELLTGFGLYPGLESVYLVNKNEREPMGKAEAQWVHKDK